MKKILDLQEEASRDHSNTDPYQRSTESRKIDVSDNLNLNHMKDQIKVDQSKVDCKQE
tara:strand:+ start:1903 stop:2076 length:174 start_codon:yes stop_codon:yes gene_type:complete